MRRDIIIPCLIAVAMGTVFTIVSEGLSLIITFVPAIPVALWLYFKTCYARTIQVPKVLPLYLLGMGFQFIHFAEEHMFGFDEKFGMLFGGCGYDHNFFVGFNMLAYFLFSLGAIGLYKNFKPFMFVAMFFIVYGMLGNAIGHIAYCAMVRGYFPGIYTSLLNLIIGPLLIRQLWYSNKVKK